jgi:hypothetical protein
MDEEIPCGKRLVFIHKRSGVVLYAQIPPAMCKKTSNEERDDKLVL